MRGRSDPAWARYYNVCGRAHLARGEGRISGSCLRAIIDQARRRAYREQRPRANAETKACSGTQIFEREETNV